MPQINWACFCNRSGYAQAAQDYLQSLKGSKYERKVSLLHSSPEQLSLSQDRYADFVGMMRTPLDPDAVTIYHCIPDMQRRTAETRRSIGFATFETFDPPQHWADILNENDAVICPSLFNVKIFKQMGVKKPIHYVPHCIDMSEYHPDVVPTLEKDGRFTFLFMGTWKKRKGWAQLLEAWATTFKPNENVKLVIKTDRHTLANISLDQTLRNLGLQRKDIAPIQFESKILTDAELPGFFKSADCLVSPTMGEGFGLPGLQCMALGVPVAITNFSGCTDYANDKTATLIEHSNFILYNEMDNIPQFRNKKWAHVSTEEVAKQMRYVLEHQSEVAEKAKLAVPYVRDNFGYGKVAEQLSQAIESVQ